MDALLSTGLSLASAAGQGWFGRESAKDQMAFQERMASTQYQRAAKDLQAAGLNRIIALGSPASAPSGASPSTPSVDVGDSYTKASSARSVIDLQKKQADLLSAQTAREQATAENIQTDTALKSGQIDNLVFQGEQTLSQAALNRKQMGMIDSNIGLNSAQVAKISEELHKIAAETRLTNANAGEAEFKKMFFEKAGPLLEKVLDMFIPNPQAKSVPSPLAPPVGRADRLPGILGEIQDVLEGRRPYRAPYRPGAKSSW